MPYKVAVKLNADTHKGSIIFPKSKIHNYGVITDMGCMAKEVYPELNIGDTVVCGNMIFNVIEGLCMLSVYDVIAKIENN